MLSPKEEFGRSRAKRTIEKLKVLIQEFINGMAVDENNLDPNE